MPAKPLQSPEGVSAPALVGFRYNLPLPVMTEDGDTLPEPVISQVLMPALEIGLLMPPLHRLPPFS